MSVRSPATHASMLTGAPQRIAARGSVELDLALDLALALDLDRDLGLEPNAERDLSVELDRNVELDRGVDRRQAGQPLRRPLCERPQARS